MMHSAHVLWSCCNVSSHTTAAEKALEKAADKADGGPAAANAAARKATSDMRIVSYYDLDVSATVETQTGVTFALGFDMGAGEKR